MTRMLAGPERIQSTPVEGGATSPVPAAAREWKPNAGDIGIGAIVRFHRRRS